MHRTVSDATHEDLVADQEKATAPSQAIHDVLFSIRFGAPLHK